MYYPVICTYLEFKKVKKKKKITNTTSLWLELLFIKKLMVVEVMNI